LRRVAAPATTPRLNSALRRSGLWSMLNSPPACRRSVVGAIPFRQPGWTNGFLPITKMISSGTQKRGAFGVERISAWPVMCLLPAALLVWPAAAAEKAAIPDFNGAWARNSFNFETPAFGPGPLTNLKRVGRDATAYILGGDPVPLVGDYKNPILK